MWLDVAAAFAAFVNDGDAGPARSCTSPRTHRVDDNGYAMYLATVCSDAKWSRNWLLWRRDNTRRRPGRALRHVGQRLVQRPVRLLAGHRGTPVNVDGSDAPPILLLGETLDAATPFAGSLEVRERFPHRRCRHRRRHDPRQQPFGGVPCVDAAVTAYLVDGTLPARQPGDGADADCAPLPEPEPTAALAAPQARAATTVMTGDLRAAASRPSSTADPRLGPDPGRRCDRDPDQTCRPEPARYVRPP